MRECRRVVVREEETVHVNPEPGEGIREGA
jgi:hypothetical protein